MKAEEIEWWGLTDIGRYRKSNEDAFLALALDGFQVQYLGKVGNAPLEDHDYIFAVSDGMGGANAGEFASRIAVEKLTYLFPHKREPRTDEECQELLKQLFNEVHEEILKFSKAYDECQGMGATLSLCHLRDGRLDYCHVGDSRIYQIRDGEISQLTQDHTHVGWLYKEGNSTSARSEIILAAMPFRQCSAEKLNSSNQKLVVSNTSAVTVTYCARTA